MRPPEQPSQLSAVCQLDQDFPVPVTTQLKAPPLISNKFCVRVMVLAEARGLSLSDLVYDNTRNVRGINVFIMQDLDNNLVLQ